ncbi:hypothetical protein CEXT_83731 [Caerostris extrusa]|uniref:LAGLIDADG homing endonuclease n=1 Tax=Caerostris extrusa TaxID=172846 RepID=A0AAV4R502_CAEEX|nr:hypothetical protein CEXT_83731 [Caerostris extrusa]
MYRFLGLSGTFPYRREQDSFRCMKYSKGRIKIFQYLKKDTTQKYIYMADEGISTRMNTFNREFLGGWKKKRIVNSREMETELFTFNDKGFCLCYLMMTDSARMSYGP